MADVKGKVCHCCAIAIANGDDSGCVDGYEHTTEDHPRPIGDAPEGHAWSVEGDGIDSGMLAGPECDSCGGDLWIGAVYYAATLIDWR